MQMLAIAMEQQFYELVAEFGIIAVFALCTVEGDITLLISGTMAHGGLFGNYGFLKVLLAGTVGGVIGDSVSYGIGRIFHENAQHSRFFKVAQPRVEALMEKFGGFAIIISKYIYGIRVAVCVSYGVAKMPFFRFVGVSAISCSLWVTLLAGLGYFFSGAVTSIIGDFKQIGMALLFIVMIGVIVFYVLERYWISERVEAANPETIHKIEEKFHAVEEVATEKLHDLGERLHLTREPNREDESETMRKDEGEKAKAKHSGQ
jgi:membrane protein DedA with SNARE-associated domain